MIGAVTIRRCATLNEALICKSLLAANDVPASIGDYYYAANEWWHVPALNGVAVTVASGDFKRAREAIQSHVDTGPDDLTRMFGDYEPPKRYGLIALWYMILDYTLSLPTLAMAFALAAISGWLDPFIPDGWLTFSPSLPGGWMPELRVGQYSPAYDTSLEPTGVLFLIVIILAFLADRLIPPPSEPEDDTT